MGRSQTLAAFVLVLLSQNGVAQLLGDAPGGGSSPLPPIVEESGTEARFTIRGEDAEHVSGTTSDPLTWVLLENVPDVDVIYLRLPSGARLGAPVVGAVDQSGNLSLEANWYRVDTTEPGPYSFESPAGMRWKAQGLGNHGAEEAPCRWRTVGGLVCNVLSRPRPELLSRMSHPEADCPGGQTASISAPWEDRYSFWPRKASEGMILVGTILGDLRVKNLNGAQDVIVASDVWSINLGVYGRTAGAGQWDFALQAAETASGDTYIYWCDDGTYRRAIFSNGVLELGFVRDRNVHAISIHDVAGTTRAKGRAHDALDFAIDALKDSVIELWPGGSVINEQFEAMIRGYRVETDDRDATTWTTAVDLITIYKNSKRPDSYGGMFLEQIGRDTRVQAFAEVEMRVNLEAFETGTDRRLGGGMITAAVPIILWFNYDVR